MDWVVYRKGGVVIGSTRGGSWMMMETRERDGMEQALMTASVAQGCGVSR